VNELTDFNDLHQSAGLDAVKLSVEAVLQGGEGAPVAETPPPRSLADFENLIDESDDHEFLMDGLLLLIARATLKRAAVERLILRIAKKCATTKAALLADYRAYHQRFGGESNVESDDETIAEINETHAVLRMEGKVVVMNREFCPQLERKKISFSSRADFLLANENKPVMGANGPINRGEYWLSHPDRAEYKGLVFSPGESVPGYCNLWHGWGMQPKAGDCSLIDNFIYELICNGDDQLYDYLMDWCAHMVQRPKELPETAIVLRGKEGIGKDTLVREILRKIVGTEHYMMMSSMQQVTGRFTGHLASTFLLFCNESVWGGDKSAQGTLKTMITDPVRPIEYKGRDMLMMQSYLRIFFATNEQWAVPRGDNDRRFIVADVSDERKDDKPFWRALYKQINGDGVPAFYDWLLKRKIDDGWHPRQVPDEVRRKGDDIKLQSNPTAQWWADVLLRGWIVEQDDKFSDDAKKQWLTSVSIDAVNRSYLDYCNTYKILHPMGRAALGKELRKFVRLDPSNQRDQSKESGRDPHYLLPDLEDARQQFIDNMLMRKDYFVNGF